MKEHVQLIKRDVAYAFWVFSEQAAYLGLPRLVLFPLVAYIMGKENFGVFSFALSITLIIGMQPQMGLSTGLLRHFSEYQKERRQIFLGTALKMSHTVMLIIVVAGVLLSLIVGVLGMVMWNVLNCLIPLLILLYYENQFLLILTEMRFLRQFRQRALWVTVRSVLGVLCGVIGAYFGGAIGLSWGYLLGNAVVYIAVRFQYAPELTKVYDKQMATVLKSIWLQITIAGILAVSIPYINRIILGIYNSYAAVADFVAATTVIFLYLAPIYCFGGLIQSMLSQYSSMGQLSRRGKIYLAVILLLGSFVLPGIMYLTGSFVMRHTFPQFGDESVRLLKILIWLFPSETISCLTRPFVYQFFPVKFIPIINLISFIAILALALAIIPGYGASGAAWGYVIVNSFTALLWVGICLKRPLKHNIVGDAIQ